MSQSRRSDHVPADGGPLHPTPWGERSAVKVTGARTAGRLHRADPTAPLAGIEFVVHPVPQEGTAS